jgi:hypothetical protein
VDFITLKWDNLGGAGFLIIFLRIENKQA